MADYETIQIRRNIIVGIFVVVALCTFGWLIFQFGDMPAIVGKLNSFNVFVQFPSAQGVQVDTPVRYCGYQIGRVTNIMMPDIREDLNTHKKYPQARVVLSIDKKYRNIPSNVRVRVITRGLGSSYIDMSISPDAPPAPADKPFFVDKMLVQGSTGTISEFFPEETQKRLDEIVKGIGDLVRNTNTIIGDPNNQKNIKMTLANLTEVTQQAKSTLKEFQEFSASAKTFANNANAKLDKGTDAFLTMSDEVTKTVVELRQVLEKINNGQGTASKFVNDGRLYEQLVEDAEQLQILLQELKPFVTKLKEKGVNIKLF